MAIGNQVPVARKPRVLNDLASVMRAQAAAAEAEAQSPKVQAVKRAEGSPYEPPVMGGFVATKGKNAGKFMHRWVFKHKANPAWSRQYDLTDLALILANPEAAKVALQILKGTQGK